MLNAWIIENCYIFGVASCFLRVSMGLTDRRETAKNLVDSGKN